MNNFFKKYKKAIFLSFIILICIIFLPPFLSYYHISDFFNLKDAGTIGDALGGITAPFISGLAAILVYIAFIEQVEANKMFKRQEGIKIVFEQFKDLRDEHDIFIKAQKR